MINTIIAVDVDDDQLGGFFNSCISDLDIYFKENNHKPRYLNSKQLNVASINHFVLNTPNLFFLAYSHGSTNELVCNNTPYISSSINHDIFTNSFFYTCSCKSAKNLGHALVQNGCLSFIGYSDNFEIWDFNQPPFVECANLGAKLFLDGITTEEVYTRMIDLYNSHIANYKNDMMGAAILLSNKRSLKHIGSNLNISHFN